ncbi:Piso0_001693 [Millerozyma farinosa CBS 7064]|uniref:Kynureninase n=1 Tax=Pichia sorbitophila (strain ATCC MYA-4447 / BCRC 22081 / CBS 7064 / NBRC 10061 / NRRL Y-12695) TaxID=559304 RepID=G8YNU8_PICSO|nr:Piso0_001693 [Millerozyma farinosa CBS 7064]
MDIEKARKLDQSFPTYRDQFEIPTWGSLGVKPIEGFTDESESTYLCGNSLGLMPKRTRQAIKDELDAWSRRGVESHFRHPKEKDGLTSWVDIDLPLVPLIAPIVGAKETEVAVMGTLTSNLNSMLVNLYKPKGKKTKILFEKKAFPSDYYAFLNIVQLQGYDSTHLLQVEPQSNETYLKTEIILQTIRDNHEEISLMCFSGIQYFTGQYFDIEKITREAKKYDIIVGWDLAHAVGNVPVRLHDWGVDFAVWCSYKYLNAGPGAIAGIFVHEEHTRNNGRDSYPPRLAGWWGNDEKTRFEMLELFDPIKSALSYRQSNPSVLDVVALRASLEIFKEAGGINKLRLKSIELTNYLEELLVKSKYYLRQDDSNDKLGFKILTPPRQEERGSQLSLCFTSNNENSGVMDKVKDSLGSYGVICDERKPDVIRIAPTALYNTFEEVFFAVDKINQALDILNK